MEELDILHTNGQVAELAYAYASEAYGATLEGSSPSLPTLLSLSY